MTDTSKLIEIRWHGRGGQGSVTSAELVAMAAIAEGKYAQAFPAFGPERRGAPVLAFNRIRASGVIRVRAEVTEPDIVLVLDPGLLAVARVTAGLKERGTLIINTKKNADSLFAEYDGKYRIVTVDATRIAHEVLGVPIVNTTMVGALLKVTDIVRMDSLMEPIKHRFGRLADKNVAAMKKAYEEAVVKE